MFRVGMILPGGAADVFERHLVDPLVPFGGVVAAAGFELLQEADHPGLAQAFVKRGKPFAANFFKRLHRRFFH